MLSVEVHEFMMLKLLYIRDLWRLETGEEWPHLDPAPEPRTIPRDLWSEFSNDWNRQWLGTRSWHFGMREAAQLHAPEHMGEYVDGPPSWQALDASGLFSPEELWQWQKSLPNANHLPLAETPVRQSIDAVISAWRHGLKSLVVFSYNRPVWNRLTEDAMEIDYLTYVTPDLFTAALDRFVTTE